MQQMKTMKIILFPAREQNKMQAKVKIVEDGASFNHPLIL